MYVIRKKNIITFIIRHLCNSYACIFTSYVYKFVQHYLHVCQINGPSDNQLI